MKRLAAGILLVSVFLFLPRSATADPAPMSVKRLMNIINGGSITIPPEWDGIWDTLDSTYDCSGAFQSTSTESDTLCSGQTVTEPGQGLSCSGSATATTLDVTCSGSEVVIPDCKVTLNYSIRGTRTGDTFFVVGTVSASYDGTAPGCDLIPDSCDQINSHGTRTGPAPSDYCATPTLPSTWGRLKIRYR